MKTLAQFMANWTASVSKATAPVHHGYPNTAAGGTGIGSGTITIPVGGTGAMTAGNITINHMGHLGGAQGFYTSSIPAVPKVKSQAAQLPPITLDGYDEIGNCVTMTLAPENGISSQELNKLMMLCMAYANAKDEFSALAYIKANNLERHFKFK